MKKRHEVPEELTWNTKDLYPTEEAYEADLNELPGMIADFVEKYKGKLSDPELIAASVDDMEQLTQKMSRLGTFANLEISADMTDDKAVKRMGKLQMVMSGLMSEISFYQSELGKLEADLIEQAIERRGEPTMLLENILRAKPHQLTPETEKAFAAMSPVMNGFYNIYEQMKQADMQFESFEVDGEEYPLSFVLFENRYNYSPNTEIRRKAFDNFSKTLNAYKNGMAQNYINHVMREKIESQLRGFDSVIDYLLFEQRVDRDLYNRQIDLIMEHLAPHMRRYAKLLQKKYNLDKMTFADLKTPLDPEFAPEVSIEEGWDYAEKALAVMGDEYLDVVKSARDGRWVDFARNVGKSTGGFCSTPYGVHPYILMSWTGLLSEVFTLVHELGHGVHFTLTHKEHPLLNSDCGRYAVEAPSTCNEMLLTNYLTQQSDDPRFRRWALASMIENTYYHNFVTHLLEAHYQREVYLALDRGEPLNANRLSELKRATLEQFWGDDVEINEGAELTWMRQPHYYMGLYPYTYSAGLTISTVASQNILKEGEPAVERWLDFLRAGGIHKPVDHAAIAGIDISTEKPLMETIDFIGNAIDEIIKLSDELA